jgi:hypothetical protein
MLQFNQYFQGKVDFKPTGRTVQSYLRAIEDYKYPGTTGLVTIF